MFPILARVFFTATQTYLKDGSQVAPPGLQPRGLCNPADRRWEDFN